MQRGLFVVVSVLLSWQLACESRSGKTKVIGETKPGGGRAEEESDSQRQGYSGGDDPLASAGQEPHEGRTPSAEKDGPEASAGSQRREGDGGATRSSAQERKEEEDSKASSDSESERNDGDKINGEASQEKSGEEDERNADKEEDAEAGETERYEKMIGDWDGAADDPPNGFRFETLAP